MSALDQYTDLRKRRDAFASMTWTASRPPARLFYPDDGQGTKEYDLTAADIKLIMTACCITENEGGSEISYAASYELGNALKAVVLRHIDKQLKAFALNAISEAEAVISTLKQ